MCLRYVFHDYYFVIGLTRFLRIAVSVTLIICFHVSLVIPLGILYYTERLMFYLCYLFLSLFFY